MATENADPSFLPSQATSEWDAVRLGDALYQLTQMHAQLRNLRTTIPTMLRPLSRASGDPRDVFQEFVRGVKLAANEVGEFAKVIQSDATMGVLDTAEKSRAARSERKEQIRPWLVNDHADWLGDGGGREAGREERKNVTGEEKSSAVDEEGMMGKILASFREAHPACRVDANEESGSIKVALSSRTKLVFRIDRKTDRDGKGTWVVRCEGIRKLHAAIQRCIAKRSNPGSLKDLLEMLVAYEDVYSRTCIVCGSLLDNKPQLPAARKKIRRPNAQGNQEVVWEAYHEDCT